MLLDAQENENFVASQLNHSMLVVRLHVEINDQTMAKHPLCFTI